MPQSSIGRCRLRRPARPSHAAAPAPILRATPMSARHCLAFLSDRNESNASSVIVNPIFGEGPLLADCVEEVREQAILDRTMRPAHGGLIVPKWAGAQRSGSALRASGGSGPWRPGGTRRERPTGLLA